MDSKSKITRVFRCKESFAYPGGTFHRGELVLETHPVVKDYPNLVEPDTLDLRDLQEFPPELVAQDRYRRVPLHPLPPAWYQHINTGGQTA